MLPQDILRSWMDKDPHFNQYIHSIIDGICANDHIYYDFNKQTTTFILKRVVVYRIDDQDPKYDDDLIRHGWVTSFPANIVNDIERGKLIYNKNGNLIKLNNMDVSELLSADHAKILHQDKMLIHKNVIHLLFDITNFFNIIGYYPRIIISNKRFKNPFSTIEQIRLL